MLINKVTYNINFKIINIQFDVNFKVTNFTPLYPLYIH